MCTSANDPSQSKLHVFESVVRFNLHESDFGTSKSDECILSPVFEVHYIGWKIQACKSHNNIADMGDNELTVKLISVFNGKTEAWSCEAEAKFKLLAKEGFNAEETRMAYFNFHSRNIKSIEKPLVTWDKLKTKHMIDGIAMIDVTVKVKPPNRLTEIQHTSTKFQMRILELTNLNEVYSEEALVRGIRWKVSASKRNEFLDVFVMANEDDMDLDYSWNVTTIFSLISMDAEKTKTKKFSNVQFDWTNTNWGFVEFIKWADLTNESNQFVKGNAALLQIELNVDKPKSKEN